MTNRRGTPPSDGRRPVRRVRRSALIAVTAAGLAPAGVALMSTTAAADVPHTGCASVAVGQSSGWCGLYPGNATDNIQELGQVSVAPDGKSLTVQTQDASTGVLAATSFACLTTTPASQITHRLEKTLCASVNGVWLPYSGGTLSVDLTTYPLSQFLNTQFTVQVAANHDANNANGDSFFNNFTVSTVSTVIGSPS